MAMKMRLTQKMAQRMALTPQMKQSIHILQLPLLELRTYLSQQLEENPTLEALSQPERRDAVSDERIHNIIEQSERYKGATESIFNAGYGQEELQKKQDYRERLGNYTNLKRAAV